MDARAQPTTSSIPAGYPRVARGVLAVAVALHLSLLLSLGMGFWNPFTFDSVATRGERGWDLFALYQAGHNVLSGVSAYESANDAIEVVVPRYTPFRYLPVSAYTVGLALNALPPTSAYWLWIALTEALLVGCAALSSRLAPDRRRGAVMAAMWLCFTPYYLEVYLGQFNVVQAALVLLMMAGAKPLTRRPLTPTLSPEYRGEGADASPAALPPEYRGERVDTPRHVPLPGTPGGGYRRGVASGGGSASPLPDPPSGVPGRGGRGVVLGAAWVLSLLWKQNTGLLVPLFLRQRRWRLLAAAALAVAVTSVPYFIAQPGSLEAFLGNLSSGAPAANLGNLGARQFLYSLASALAPGLSPTAHLWLQRAWVTIIVSVGLGLTLRDRRPPTLLHLCLWTTSYLLIYHHVWEHHYILALPALVMLYRRDGSPWVLTLWALLAVWTPYALVDPGGVAAYHAPMRWTPLEPPIIDVAYHGAKALPAVALWAHVVAAIARGPRGEAP